MIDMNLVALLATLPAMIAVHEVGHYLVAWHYHLKPRFSHEGITPVVIHETSHVQKRNGLVKIAGPIAGIVFALLFLVILPLVISLVLILNALLGSYGDISELRQ